ncbi:yellow-5 precursor [Tribolium castaneum]|uniref:Protein yellow-like Protein n=1 Tax=Tribolium castaneum TaxID=7070 RepID=D6WH83_TRICA|nr:yellow-5 precursor [Tribolium castaneum]EEZ99739.1 Protein yellow-like Protein [Tribolium castaneum]|eukprot:NP_001165862.1 yellow-5 precursor [Tribolium castaneum]
MLFFFLLTFSSSRCTTLEESVIAPTFEITHQWSYINFTWESSITYEEAIDSGDYIPENVAMTGIKFYRNRWYIALPKFRPGVPVTLAYFFADEAPINPLLTPYPDWDSNTDPTCEGIKAVQSMEIDRSGVMWVLDGFRVTPATACPTKLIWYDLNTHRRIRSYTFPETIGLRRGGFLNDIVVDDTGYAYITDNSAIDPGLIVFSVRENRAWKFRDASMFPQIEAANFVVDDWPFRALAPIDGIALTPRGSNPRVLLYCSLTGFSVFGISTEVLKREDLLSTGDWRAYVTYLGDKQAQGDGMAMDNFGNLYYGLLPLYAVGKWDVFGGTPPEILYQNRSTVIWPDSFAFDNQGYTYVLANTINKFGDINFRLVLNDEIKFRIFRFFTGSQSYLF